MKRSVLPLVHRRMRSMLARPRPAAASHATPAPAASDSSLLASGSVGAIECLESRIAPAAVVASGILIISGDDGGLPIDDQITIEIAGGNIQITQNGVILPAINPAVVQQIHVETGAGNDSLTLNFINGNVIDTGGLNYVGGSGFNTLSLVNGAATTDIHTAGPQVGQGSIELTIPGFLGATGTISYQDLAPVNDFLAGPLVINATHGDNAINYVIGRNDADTADAPSRGKVTIDEFEPVQFSNKTSLVINGLGGRDTINLNNPTAVPTGLTSIAINGGNPGGASGDKLIITGSTDAEDFFVSLTGVTSGEITHTNVSLAVTQPAITFLTIESLEIDGGSDDNDDELTIETESGFDVISYTPGATHDSGLVQVRSFGGTESTVPVSFLRLGEDGLLNFLSAGGIHQDQLEVHGTAAANFFNVDSAGDVDLDNQITLTTLGVNTLSLFGYEGNDRFSISGEAPLLTIAIDAGGPDELDSVTLLGSAGADTLNFVIASGGGQFDAANGSLANLQLTGVEDFEFFGFGGDDDMLVTNLGAATSLRSISLDADSNNDILDIFTTNIGDDHVVYTPGQGESTFQNVNGASHTVVRLSNYTFTPFIGTEKVTVKGSSTNNITAVSIGPVTHSVAMDVGVVRTLDLDASDLEALVIDTGLGNDTIMLSGLADGSALNSLSFLLGEGSDLVSVDFNAGNPLPAGSGLNIDGGQGFDSLTLFGGAATEDIYTPGAAVGAGTIDITTVGAPGSTRINFAGFEPVIDLVPGPLVVNANHAANAISYAAGSVVTNGLVGIDDHETIEFSNKTILTINALGGSDTISITNPNIPTGLTSVVVNGGDPAADSDTVLVLDIDAVAPVAYTPTGVNSGLLADANGVPVTVASTEKLTLAGAGLNSGLIVNGGALADIFDYQPGSAFDAGLVKISSGGAAQLGLGFSNLGATGFVSFAGAAGADTLIYRGTSKNDSFAVSGVVPVGNISLQTALGAHIVVDDDSIETLTLDAGGGADQFLIADVGAYLNINVDGGDAAGDAMLLQAVVGNAENITIAPSTIDPTRQTISGLTAAIAVSGMEVIGYAGSGIDDSLTLDLGFGDNTAVVSADSVGDRVLSDSLPEIKFIGLNIFTIDADSGVADGSDVVTFKTGALFGAVPANYRLLANADDTLVIEGGNGLNDAFTVTNPAGAPSVAVATTGGVTVTEFGGALGHLVINGLGGDDVTTVDFTGGLLTMPVTFNGALGHDRLVVTGDAGVTTTTYTPGSVPADGRLTYAGAITSIIDFTGLEPVQDNVASANLIVNATNAANAITYGAGALAGFGRVAIDGYEVLDFSNKTTLTLNALGGDDLISISNGTVPTGLTSIVVNAGDPSASDKIIIDGTAAADVFTFLPTSANAGSVTVTGLPTVTYSGAEFVTLNGLAGADTFNVAAATGRVEVIGGAGADTVSFSTSLVPIVIDMDLVGVAQRVSTTDEEVKFGDLIENLVATAFNDLIRIDAQPFARSIDGGPEVSNPPGDTLHVDAKNTIVAVNFATDDDGTVTPFGHPVITFTDIETIDTFNVGGSGSGGTGSLLSASSFSAPIDYNTGKGPRSVSTGDVDGDGDIDMVVSSRRFTEIGVFLNRGDGTFEPAVFSNSGSKRPTALTLGDFDGDLDLDLAVTSGNQRLVTILENNGGGTYAVSSTIPVQKAPRNIIAGDVNNDGDLDLVVSNSNAGSVSVLLGAGGLSFGGAANFDTGGRQPRDVAIFDVNLDGDLDLVVANAKAGRKNGNIGVLEGDGAGNFAPALTFGLRLSNPVSLVSGDFNQDGLTDIAFADLRRKFLGVMLNESTGGTISFTSQLQTEYPRAAKPAAIATGDFNFDGKIDVAMLGRFTDEAFFMLGNGNGTFNSVLRVDVDNIGYRTPTALAIADLNNDGAVDVIAAAFKMNTVSVMLRNI